MGTSNYVDLYLVRHGITRWNIEKRYLGNTDKPIEQSMLDELIPLKIELNSLIFDDIITSDLRRCIQTGKYLKNGCAFKTDENLREFHFGDWEGKTYEDLKHCQTYRQWIDDWETNKPPGGESAVEFKTRVEFFINKLLESVESNETKIYHKFLVVTHGGVIRYLLSKFIDSSSFWSWQVKHSRGIRILLKYEEGGWKWNSLSEVPMQENGKSLKVNNQS